MTRDSPLTVEERECDNMHDSASNHSLTDTSSSNYIEATNPQEQSPNARVQRRSLTVASAVFRPDVIDDECTSIQRRMTSDGGGGGGASSRRRHAA